MRLWRERTFLEQVLLLLLLCFLIILIGLSITVGVRNKNGWGCPLVEQREGSKIISNQSEDCTQSKYIEHYCTSRSCINLAAELVNSLDETTDPCDDFYEYACRNWMTHTFLENQDRVTKDSYVDETILLKYKDLLEEPPEDGETVLPEHFFKARNYYSTCVDWVERELDGVGSFLEDLSYVGGCPLLTGDQWNGTSFNYMSSLVRLSEKGFRVNFLLNVQVQTDPRNTSKLIISIGLPDFVLRDPSLLDQPESTSVILDYMEQFMEYLCKDGPDNVTSCSDSDTHTNQLEQVIEVEKTLSKILSTTSGPDMKEVGRTYLKIGDLQTTMKELDWLTLVQLHLNSYRVVNPEEEVMLDVSLESLKKLSLFLNDLDNTENGRRTLANYFTWQAIAETAPDLSQDMRLMYYDLLSNLDSRQEIPELWRHCLVDTATRFRFSMASSFVDKYAFDFSVTTKPLVENLITLVRTKMKRLINETYWLDDAVKKSALTKVDKLYITVGYPEGIRSESKVNSYYKKLSVENDHYKNSRNGNVFLKSKSFGRFGKVVDRSDWELFPTNLLGPLSSGYLYSNNSAYISLGLAQGPFFQVESPMYVNFARLGVVVAHLMAQAFDDQGSQFDASGNRQDWWSSKTRNNFVSKSSCFYQAYEASLPSGPNATSKSHDMISRILAEQTALRETYKAYVQEVNARLPQKLPGLDQDPKQLFWTSYATAMCEKLSNSQSTRPSTGTSAADRVNALLSGSKHFGRDFHCPPESKMRNEDRQKCRVWGP